MMLLACEPADLGHNGRIAVLASGSGSNFEAICAACDRELNATVVGLVVNIPRAGAVARAARLGVPCTVVEHRKFRSRDEFDAAVGDALAAFEPDVIAMAGWMRIATRTLLDRFRGRVVNIHPSLLPSFPGLHGIEQAFEAGVKVTGCTVHYVVPEVDAGPVIGQAAVAIRDEDTLESLTERVHEAEHVLYPRALARALDDVRRR